MIVWLASYPRSGNTLMRILLSHVFGLPVPSLQPGGRVVTGREGCGGLLPPAGGMPETQAMDEEAFTTHARALPGTVIVKTHGAPPAGDEPAIVLVRDGRAAMASYQRYRRTFAGQEMLLEQIVSAPAPLPHWSHLTARWRRRTAPTLLLRFERVIRTDAALIEEIGRFLGCTPQRGFDLGFEDLRRVSPDFFSVGSDAPGIALVEKRCPALFWTAHGDAMRALGYGAEHDRPFNRRLVGDALAEAGRAMRRPTGAAPDS
ncbi:sulfotransferase domain-containing protein [Sphingomonas sp.]|uniref:sulfotransferase domain-containing protein n=1 Tax=Sphingomonas sp. TaxID=28214 RepID=UPI0035C83C49